MHLLVHEPDDVQSDSGKVNEGVPTLRAFAYARVSTDDQAASGLGVEAQLHACRQWAGREGRVIAAERIDDGVGGATGLEARPGLIEVLAELRPGDVVLVAKRDRLGRDPIVVAMIEAAVLRKGGRIVSAAGEGTEGDDPTNVLMRRIIDAFSEYERLVIKCRTKAALAAKRRRGERIGQVPWGETLAPDGRTVSPNEAEAAIGQLMVQWRAARMSWRAIAAELTRLDVPTKKGGPWRPSSIVSIVGRLARREVT